MKTYTDRNTAPLAFHSLFLWVGLPLGMIVEIYNLYSELSNYEFLYYSPILYIKYFFIFETICVISSIVLRCITFWGLRKWKLYSWYIIHIRNAIMIIYSFASAALYVYLEIFEAMERFALYKNVFLAIFISSYYWRRRPLFLQDTKQKIDKIEPQINSHSEMELKSKISIAESENTAIFDNQISLDDLQTQPKSVDSEISSTPKQGKNVKKIWPYVCFVCLICSLIGNITLYNSNTKLIKENTRALSDVKYWKHWHDVEDEHAEKLAAENYKMRDEYNFYHNNAVIVTEYGYRYHRYGCSHTYDCAYWIYNIENAEYQGYTPCKDCWQ